MQGNELTVIGFGVVSIGFLVKLFFENKAQFKAEDKLFAESHQKMIQKRRNTQFPYQKDEQTFICVEKVKPTYNPSTFKLHERQRSKSKWNVSFFSHERFIENQMGGDFKFTLNKEEVRCKLNDFAVSQTLFKEQKKDVHIFKGLNELEPCVETVTTTLNPSLYLSMFGKIYYDSNKIQWAFQPLFVAEHGEFFQKVSNYYQQKKVSNNIYRAAIAVGVVVLGYFAVIKPLRTWLRKRQNIQKQRKKAGDIDFFKDKEYLMVKGSNLLNCEQCREKSVDIVYDCGHLSLCERCHELNEIKECPICKKESTKFLRIYLA